MKKLKLRIGFTVAAFALITAAFMMNQPWLHTVGLAVIVLGVSFVSGKV